MSAAGATRAESHDRAMGVALSTCSRATLRRPTTGHLIGTSTSGTALYCFPSRTITCQKAVDTKRVKCKTPHLALGAGGAFIIAPGSGNSSSYSTEYASLNPVLHRSSLTAADHRALSGWSRRLPSRTLESRDNSASRPSLCAPDGLTPARNISHARTSPPQPRRMALPASRRAGWCQRVAWFAERKS